jgi:hypothetical protein
MRSLNMVLALLALLPKAGLGEPILQIQLNTRSYEVSSDLLAEWEVKIDIISNSTTYPPRRFDERSLLITFPVLSSSVSSLICVPQVLDDFAIWPNRLRGPLQSSRIQLEVKRVSDVVRAAVENGKNGLTGLVIGKRWQEASELYEDVSEMLLACELHKVVTTPNVFLQEFAFRDDVLDGFERIAEKRGYREGAAPKEFLDLYEETVFDGVRGWKGDVQTDQALARLFVFIDRWRGFAYSQYLAEDSQSPTFYTRTLDDDKMFLSPEAKHRFLKAWKTIAEQLRENEVLKELQAAATKSADDKKAAFDRMVNYINGTVDTTNLKFLDVEKVADDLKATHKANRQ